MRSINALRLAALLLPALTACNIDQVLLQEATRDRNPVWPLPLPTLFSGTSDPAFCAGAAVNFYAGAGDALPAYATTVSGECAFSVEFPGDTAVNALRIEVLSGARQALGMLPQLPRRADVREGQAAGLGYVPLALASVPGKTMETLGKRSTAATLLLLAKAKFVGVNLAGLPKATLEQAFADIGALFDGADADIQTYRDMVGRLYEAAATAGRTVAPFLADYPLGGTPSPLRSDFLLEADVDYTGDGVADTSTEAFDRALEAAMLDLQLELCYPTCPLFDPDDPAVCDAAFAPTDDPKQSRWIRVVFMADMNDGKLNRNCQNINRFKWTVDEAGKSMFIVGGTHGDTPVCPGEKTDACLTQDEVSALQQKLGDWQPNQIPMYDDGTHGDAVAGDRIWTLTLVVPYIHTYTDTDQERPGVRVEYKYNWAFAGAQGWTGNEEWPGNSRLLELEDVNGDLVVTRYDYFGDETTNKDDVNLYLQGGGCPSSITWHLEQKAQGLEACVMDTRENLMDSDGDCTLDTWPSPSPNGPVLQDCPAAQ